MKTPPELGQTLYSLNVGNAAGYNSEQKLTPLTVTAIGRKYFTCHPVGMEDRSFNGIQFHLENWREKTEFCSNHKLYESVREWHDEKEANNLSDDIGKAFKYGHNVNTLPLERLREIHALLTVIDHKTA